MKMSGFLVSGRFGRKDIPLRLCASPGELDEYIDTLRDIREAAARALGAGAKEMTAVVVTEFRDGAPVRGKQ